MIPTIIYFLLRRYKRTNPAKAERLILFIRKGGRILLLFVLLILIGYFALPQDTRYQYTIKRKGSEIGIISFSQQRSATGHGACSGCDFYQVNTVSQTAFYFLKNYL